ncbi:xylose isomerase [Shinella sp. SUS2]|uniref:sugar phosphate isomerase/epimerase family protein n=1 Tax=unclassified Shinella TaxID=2643062 RepID=UPI00067FD5BE|nr:MULTISPECIES: sugar phosphate isomerase/epimerase family protein [unclassified Shinella]KNY11901.1 xylose isomerase [Shinella sp. SUS2]KOC71585.1 xylose isomerase [Shinella sp. GWS1]
MRDFSRDHSALALNTASLGHNLEGRGAGWEPERVIDACAARGFGSIVFWRREIGLRAVEIGDRARAAGLAVAGLCRTPFLVGADALDRAAVLDEAKASIDMAAGLGAAVLTIVVGGVHPGTKGTVESLRILADRVADLVPYAAERRVKLALEPLNPVYAGNRSCLTTVRDAVDICEMVDMPNLGLAVDVYHVWWDSGLDAQLRRAGKDRIFGYHLCDWLADTQDVLLDRGMMGDGVADLKTMRASVEGAGYAGPCEVEIFSANNWWKRDPGDVLDVMVERFRTIC